MRSVIRFFQGTVTAAVTGAETEKLLNLCAREMLPFRTVKRQDELTLTLQVSARHFSRLQALGEKVGCEVTAEKKRGVPFFCLRFRHRYALLAGFLLCLLSICMFSRIVLVIDIEGNERVSAAEIMTELRRNGVTVGTYGPSIQKRELAHKMLLALDDLSFFSLNLHGTRAEVVVREKDPKPNIVEEEVPTDVISNATGIIIHMETLKGDPLYKTGDTVLEGEKLISGTVVLEGPLYGNGDIGTMPVHAQGKIYARTWHTMSAEIPLTAGIKEYNGEKATRYSLSFLGKRINFYRNGGISFPKYDKITKYHNWISGNGTVFPISLEKETLRAYEIKEVPLDTAAAEQMLKDKLLAELSEGMDEGEVKRTDFVTTKDENFLIVTLLAECTEQIGKVVPMETEAPAENAELEG